MSNKEPTEAQGCLSIIGVVLFLVCFYLGEKEWLTQQWKEWGCLIRVCLSPFVAIGVLVVIATLFRKLTT